MTDDQEIKLVGESAKGARANALLNSDIYQEAMGKVEAGILQAWKDSPIRDTEGQQYLRLMMKALRDLQGYITEIAQTGKLANIQLEQERNLKQRMKAAVHELRR